MTERKSFQTQSPIPFDLGDDEIFMVIGAVPAAEFGDLLDLQSGISTEGTKLQDQLVGIKAILSSVMLADSWERFEPRLSDRSRPVSFPLLLEITNWLVAEWSGRPLPSASSSTEPPGTTETGTDGSLPEVSDLTESPPVEVSVVPDI